MDLLNDKEPTSSGSNSSNVHGIDGHASAIGHDHDSAAGKGRPLKVGRAGQGNNVWCCCVVVLRRAFLARSGRTKHCRFLVVVMRSYLFCEGQQQVAKLDRPATPRLSALPSK